MKKEWSVKEQKNLFQKLGYDTSKWNPNNQKEQDTLFELAINAQVRGLDAQGNPLSADDLGLLSVITGRGI